MEKPDFPCKVPVKLTFILTVLFIRYWRCDIKGAPSGKLQDKTVAIKDNTCVAGVPMMNGSRILDGFVPDIDATVVSRILDAGGHIVGKAVCENLCCDGGSFTAATGPVVNPHNKTRMAGGSSSGSAALVRRGVDKLNKSSNSLLPANADRRPLLQRGLQIFQLQTFQLYNKLLKYWSLGKQWKQN